MQAVVKNINGSYLIELNAQSSDMVVINGKEHRNFTNGYIAEEPKNIHILRKISVIDKFGDMSPEDYNEKRKLLYKEYFDSLDEEFTYKKFLEDNKPVYKDEIQKIEFEIVVMEYVGQVDNPMIIPFRLLGQKKEGVLYKYICKPYLIAKQVGSEFGLTETNSDLDKKEGEKTWSVPTHSIDNLRFAKVMGWYARYEYLPSFYGIEVGTYEECSKRYKEHYEAIKEMFNYNIAKYQAIGKDIDKAYILSKLEHIENSTKSTEITKRDTSKLNTLRIIRDLRKELTQ